MATKTMARWRPFAEFADLRSRLDRLFEDVGLERANGGIRAWSPEVDLIKKDGQLVLRVDCPGIEPEEIKAEVEDDILTVSGEHEETQEEEKENYMRRERRFGAFSRSIPLPAGADAEKVDATCQDGVLEVTVPLPKEAEKSRVEITPKAR